MTFEQLEDLFFKLRVKADPSGFHGFLCGRLCCGKMPLDQLIETSTGWLGLSEEQADGAAYPLRDFYETSLTSLEDVAFLFQPVLPDDELPLPERLVAVGQWCSNYLSGVGDGMTDGFAVTDDVKEALEDISAIAQISVDFESDDEGERDYAELIEYIRIAVQLIFSELHPEAAGNSGPTVH